MNAIVLVVDGLQAGYLGPYGNSWVPTPEFNRLAATSFLFDQAYLDSPRLESIYRSYWSGAHAEVKPALVDPRGLTERLSERGIATSLTTDDALIAEHPWGSGFRERLYLRPTANADAPFASELSETELGQFFAELIGQLGKQTEPYLLWGHTRGLTGAWDAPWELRKNLLDQEEDELDNVRAHLEELHQAPHAVLPSDVDPDDILALRLAYAAQIQVLDSCLAALTQAMDEASQTEPTLLAVLGARGFPLGQHGRVGYQRPLLHEEMVHVPWILRMPEGTSAGARTQSFAQPADLAATLCDWFGAEFSIPLGTGAGRSLLPLARGEEIFERDRILITDEAARAAVRTRGWYFVREAKPSAAEAIGESEVRLYAKPDDRWELNEVADRCGDVANDLEGVLDELVEGTSRNSSQPARALDPILVEGLA